MLLYHQKMVTSWIGCEVEGEMPASFLESVQMAAAHELAPLLLDAVCCMRPEVSGFASLKSYGSGCRPEMSACIPGERVYDLAGHAWPLVSARNAGSETPATGRLRCCQKVTCWLLKLDKASIIGLLKGKSTTLVKAS